MSAEEAASTEAPVAEVQSTEEAPTTTETTATPASEVAQPEPTPTTSTPAQEAAAPASRAPTAATNTGFDVNTWSGKAEELPEEFRGISRFYEERLKSLQMDKDFGEQIIKALQGDDEHPEVAKIKEKYAQEVQEREAAIQRAAEAEKAAKSAADQHEEYLRKEQELRVADFERRNPDLFDTNSELHAKFSALIQKNVYFEDAAKIVRLSDEAQKEVWTVARQYPGSSVDAVIEIAKIRAKDKSRHSESSHAIAGSGTSESARMPTHVQANRPQGSLEDRMRAVVRRNIKRHTG